MDPINDRQREAVDAACALFDAQPPSAFFPSSRAIAAEANCARNTLANRFGSSSHHAVLRYIASEHALTTDEGDFVEKLLHEIEATARVFPLMKPDGPPLAIASIAREHIADNLADRRGFRRQLAFALAATTVHDETEVILDHDDVLDREEFAKCLADTYQSIMDGYVPLYELVLAEWGRELRTPVTIRSLALGLTALTEGLMLRHLVDPTVTDNEASEVFGSFIYALLNALTVPKGAGQESADLADLGRALTGE